MPLSEIKVFNTKPEVKPVVRVNADNKAEVAFSACALGSEIASRYVDYHTFLNVSQESITLSTPKEFVNAEYLSQLNRLSPFSANKKPTC